MFFIPNNINELARLKIATLFRDSGLPIIPFVPRQKKPAIKGWPEIELKDCNDLYLKKWWVEENSDLGVGVREPLVIVDFDGPGDPEVVLAWINQQPLLANAPRERTSRGAHVWLICPTMPESVRAKELLVSKLPGGIGAEAFVRGRAVRTTPSGLTNGGIYQFEQTGSLPEILWPELQKVLNLPVDFEKNSREQKKDEKSGAWKRRFKGDLTTLDVVSMLRASKSLQAADTPDPEDNRLHVYCPWNTEHSKPAVLGSDPPSSDTVVFFDTSTQSRKLPGFHCLHAHCKYRGIREFLLHIEKNEPGLVDAHCTVKRPVWTGEGASSGDGRRRIVLPCVGRLISEFSSEVGAVLGPNETWFYKDNTVVRLLTQETQSSTRLSFEQVTPAYARTAIEEHLEPGILTQDRETDETLFTPHTASADHTTALLASHQLTNQLPIVQRVLATPIPLEDSENIYKLPRPGYDARFFTITQPGAPKLKTMTIEDAKNLLITLHDGFCLADKQSGVHALARIITPYCRGIMGFDHRPPVWHYSANRPRAGKDYLAGLAHLIYEGNYTEDAPIGKQPEETRKRITSAIRSGRRFMHFANCQGNLDDENFIGATTKIGYGDRSLGSNSGAADLTMRNEIEFSFSGNQGITFRPDVEPRTRKIELFFGEEDANSRKFLIADLHGFVVQNRWAIISAIDTLVTAWLAAGAPLGQTPFTSFPRWAAVVGGIMTFHGLGDPCLPHNEDVVLCDSDAETAAMKEFFQVAYVELPDQWVKTAVLTKLAADQASNEESFEVFGELNEKPGQTRFGRMIRRYVGRELGGIVLRSDGGKRKTVFRFSKGGGVARVSVFAGASAKAVDNDVTKCTQGSGEDEKVGDSVHQEGGSPEENETKRETLSLRSLRTPFSSSQPNSFKEDYKKEVIIYDVYDSTSGGTLEKGDRSYRSDKEVHCFTGNLLVRHSDLAEVAAKLTDSTSIALDLETYGTAKGDALNPRKGDIRLLTLQGEGGPVIILDLQAIGYDLGPLHAVLEKTEIIAHNAKFDLGWLVEKCEVRPTRVFCTCTASCLLGHGLKEGHGLDEVIERHLGVTLPADQSRSDWSAPRLTQEQLAYAAADVTHLHPLAEKLRDNIVAAGLSEVVALEMGVLSVVVGMEHSGVLVDGALLKVIADEAAQSATAKEAELRSLLNTPALNASSTKQITAALNGIGCFVESTAVETLKEQPDPTGSIAVLLAHRKHNNTSKQARTLLKAIESDGRIHCSFNPCGTDTGRFSSSDPNLQSVPRGAMRTAFTPSAGMCLIKADYSQIELRIAAVVAGETKMLEAYARGVDIHEETAAAVLGIAVETVTREDRHLAKAVNFGLLYGQRAKGLVKYAALKYEVPLTVQQAEQIRKLFFARYQGLKRWHSQAWKRAEERVLEVRTRLGRRRLLPNIATKWDRFSALVNAPVQGGAADGMKRAIVDLAANLPEGAFIVSTVHDELIVEAPLEIAEQVKELTCSAMVKAMSEIYPEVPIVVEASVCSNWGAKA